MEKDFIIRTIMMFLLLVSAVAYLHSGPGKEKEEKNAESKKRNPLRKV